MDIMYKQMQVNLGVGGSSYIEIQNKWFRCVYLEYLLEPQDNDPVYLYHYYPSTVRRTLVLELSHLVARLMTLIQHAMNLLVMFLLSCLSL